MAGPNTSESESEREGARRERSMTKQDAPEPRVPVLVEIRFNPSFAQTLSSLDTVARIDLRKGGYEAHVSGPSVFIRAKGGGECIEVPRSVCSLRWECEGMEIGEAVKQIEGGRRK